MMDSLLDTFNVEQRSATATDAAVIDRNSILTS